MSEETLFTKPREESEQRRIEQFKSKVDLEKLLKGEVDNEV